MVDKCSKCGADLSADAVFCPLCGTSKAAEPAQAQPAPVAPPLKPIKSGPGGMEGFIDFVFSLKMIVIGLFIAILVAWITKLVGQFVTLGNAALAVNIVNFTFMAGAGAILLFGGLLNNKFNIYVRAALIVAGALTITINL